MSKSINLKTRITEELHEAIKARAEAEGVKVSRLTRDFIRFGLKGLDPAAVALLKKAHQDLNELKLSSVQIGGNLNQIAYHLNSGGRLIPADLQGEHENLVNLFKEVIGQIEGLTDEIKRLAR